MNKWTKVTLVALGAAALLSAALWAGYRTDQAATKIVRIGTFSTAIDYSPLYIAKDEGWLDEVAKKDKIKIEYPRFDTLPAINDALAAKKLDIILEADTPGIIQKASGNDLVALYPLASLALEILVPVSSTATRLADLKGKRIGILFGTGHHYGFVSGLPELGLSVNDFTLVNLPPPEARAAFAAKTIDAWLVWPPFVQQEVVAGTGKAIPGTNARPNVFMFASADFVKNNGPVVDDIIEAIKRAKTYINTNPKQSMAIVAKETDLPEPVVSLAWPKIDFDLKFTPAVLTEMNKQADFLAKGGYIAKAVQIQPEFFYRSGLK